VLDLRERLLAQQQAEAEAAEAAAAAVSRAAQASSGQAPGSAPGMTPLQGAAAVMGAGGPDLVYPGYVTIQRQGFLAQEAAAGAGGGGGAGWAVAAPGGAGAQAAQVMALMLKLHTREAQVRWRCPVSGPAAQCLLLQPPARPCAAATATVARCCVRHLHGALLACLTLTMACSVSKHRNDASVANSRQSLQS
jgi:hypothetical protein